ncbi:hypothetical protein PsorP6_005533 [Peronosclerospora sorghi]|uniref:Uncharacterized protein n=1 Tax=Peronosclerospora sorghi TaxID=230839 RepID=A0ACC0W5Y3_9STRA|nr:hypothetical protein PsorP6_005533 [Peronosclerospora sorghi]
MLSRIARMFCPISFFKLITWHEIEQAPTLEEFQKLWKELEGKVDEATYAYLEKNKLPLREHWASYFIDQFQHLKATLTSRTEGKHWASIKSNGSSNATILTLYTTIYDNCSQQLTDYQTAVDTYAGNPPRIMTDKVKLQKKRGNGFKFGVRVKQSYKEVAKSYLVTSG